MPPLRSAPSRFAFGLAAPLRAVGFIFARPSLWGWALVPMGIALGCAIAASYGVTAIGAHVGAWLSPHLGGLAFTLPAWLEHVFDFVVRLLVWIAVAIVSLLIGLALAQPLSGFALDRLVRAHDASSGVLVDPPRAQGGRLEELFRSLRVMALGLAVSLPIGVLLFAIEVVVPPASVVTTPLHALLGALTVAWDLLDYPFAQRGFGVRARVRWIGEHFAEVLGFGIVASAMLIVPGFGLLMLPAGVVAAAAVVRRGDGAARLRA